MAAAAVSTASAAAAAAWTVPVPFLFALRGATEKNERPLSEQVLMYAQERGLPAYSFILPTVIALCSVSCAFVCFRFLSRGAKDDEGGGGGGGGGEQKKKKDDDEGGDDEQKWQHYGNGRWNTFSEAAHAWLRAAVDGGSAELEEEHRGHPAKSRAQRRIRCQGPGGVGDWRWFLIAQPLMKQLQDM